MRIVVQRVIRASVSVDEELVASIGPGLLLLVGVADGDSEDDTEKLARKCAEMRIFADEEGKFSLSLLDTGGEALVVSQFTLLGDVRRGRRPSFAGAAQADAAEPLVRRFADELRSAGVVTQTGVFGATMAVELVNDGPVTILLASDELKRPRRGG